MNHPFVKKFVEERDLTLMLVVDLSGSGFFGSREQSKRETGRRNRLRARLLGHPQQRQGRPDAFQRGGGEIHPAQAKGAGTSCGSSAKSSVSSRVKRGTNFIEALDSPESAWRVAHAIVVIISDFLFEHRSPLGNHPAGRGQYLVSPTLGPRTSVGVAAGESPPRCHRDSGGGPF